MVRCLYMTVSAAAALWIGFAFLHMRGLRPAVISVLMGLLFGGSVFLPGNTGIVISAVLLLSVYFILHFLSYLHLRSLILPALFTQCAYALFQIPYPSFMMVGILEIAVSVLIGMWMQDAFPDPAWHENFSICEEKKNISGNAVYMIAAVPAAVVTGISFCLKMDQIIECAAVSLLCLTLFWFGVWLVTVLIAFQKEKTAVRTEQMYRNEMQSFLNVIRSQRHDYNFHVQTIAGLIRQGKVDECLNYVNALEEDTAIMNSVLPVRDPAVSAMIHSFRLLAVRQGIEMHVDIHYDLSQIATNVYETNKIISNLLQNAIDEVSSHQDKSYGIWLTVLKRGEYCVIRVENKIQNVPSQTQIGSLYQQGYTTKTGHEGVGLSSLKTLLARYHGVIYTQIDGDVIQFTARVPIDYAKESVMD